MSQSQSQSRSRRGSWLSGAPSVTGRGINGGSSVTEAEGRRRQCLLGMDRLGAPGAMPANLPDWSEVEGKAVPTSLPIHQIQRDLDFSMYEDCSLFRYLRNVSCRSEGFACF
jgi:hypothetical protein